VSFATGIGPVSVAIGDLNGDGRSDLVFACINSSTASVLFGNGDGTFGPASDYATANVAAFAAIGDLNRDGKPDVAVADTANQISILLGNGDGTLAARTDIVAGYHPLCIAIADLDGDGNRDLVTSNQYSNTVSVLPGNGDGTFRPKRDYGTGSYPYFVTIGDLNRDGMPDLVTANSRSPTVSVLINLGLTPPTAVLLSFFQASWAGAGIELRWAFGVPGSVAAVQLQRSEAAAGPWSDVNGERRDEGEAVILLDRDVEAGREYFYRMSATMSDGSVSTFGPFAVAASSAVDRFGLLGVSPSLSYGVARIAFEVGREARVRLSVLDVQGRVVARLADGVYRPGRYEKTWDSGAGRGRAPAGLYFVRYEWPEQSVVRRLMLVR
jgi:hypothetical protein